MALFHVHADVIEKGKGGAGAAGFARYIAREDADHALQFLRYIDRDKGREDLVAKGEGGLPAWAINKIHFWTMADRYERGGPQRPGTVARTYEIALPRELSPDARQALAADMRATFFAQYPHSWAIHTPIDSEGREHPHMHLMLSERRATDGIERGAAQYFRQAAGPQQDPATHGVRKDRSWQGPTRLRELRAGIAMITNAALERAGQDVAVSHASLRTQGHERAPAIYTTSEARPEVEARREVLHRDYHPWENDLNRAAWHAQKQREGIQDLSREALVDHVRDRFWRHDRSPMREQERQASLERAIAREYARAGREYSPLAPPERERERDLDHQWERPLIGNVVSRIYHTPEQHNYGDVRPQNQVRFWTERDAIEAGYRRAMNDHYGPGSGVAQEPDARRRGTRRGVRAAPGSWNRDPGHALADSMQGGVHIQMEEEYDRGYAR